MINLSRNAPTALIVGASGFIGSHLTDKLLSSGVQVVGVDPYTGSNRVNLNDASKDKNFHFFNQRFSSHAVDFLPKINYAFFVVSEELSEVDYLASFEQFLSLLRKIEPSQHPPKVVLVSSIELYDHSPHSLKAVKEAEKRLAQFGKDEGFNVRVVRLAGIYGPRMHFRNEDPLFELLTLSLNGELETRSLPLDFTTRAIFIDDVINLLMKTVLHGSTSQKLYDGALLHPIKISEIRQVLLDPLWHQKNHFSPTPLPAWPTPNLEKTQKELSWSINTAFLTGLKKTMAFLSEHQEYIPKKELPKEDVILVSGAHPESHPGQARMTEKKRGAQFNFDFKRFRSKLGVFLGLGVIVYGLILPIASLIIGGASIRYHLQRSNSYLNQGEYQKAKDEATYATEGVRGVDHFVSSLDILSSSNLFKDKLEAANGLFEAISNITYAQERSVEGFIVLQNQLKVLSGEEVMESGEGELSTIFRNASSLLGTGYAQLEEAETNPTFKVIASRIKDLKGKTLVYKGLADSGYSLSYLYPYLIEGKKQYLVLLIDKSEIKELVKVSFEDGSVSQVSKVGLSDFGIDKSFKETDFAVFAKSLQWMYNRQGGSLSGVVLVTQDTLNKSGASSLQPFLENMFYVSSSAILKQGQLIGDGLRKKQLVIYSTDPHAFSYLTSLGFTGLFPRASKNGAGERSQFLSPQLYPASLTKKAIKLDDYIDNAMTVTHKLEVKMSELEGDASLKIYSSSGSKLIKATINGVDATPSVKSFSDYGWSGFDLSLTKSTSPVVVTLEYQDALPLAFENHKLLYRVDLFKQLASSDDSLEYTITTPGNVKLVSGSRQFSLDLSENRSLQLELSK